MPPRSRAWILTINDVGDGDPPTESSAIEPLFLAIVHASECTKSVGQVERAPTTGRLHWQIALYFSQPAGFAALSDRLRQWVPHVEASANWTRIKRYCQKSDTRAHGPYFFPDRESVEAVNPGKRTDLDSVAELILARQWDRAIAEFPGQYIRYSRGFQALMEHAVSVGIPLWRTVDVLLLWGDSGVGKTRYCYEATPGLYRLCLGGGNSGSRSVEWWDGYQGQPVVLLDDFYGQLPLSRLLNLLDGYPMLLPTKGSHVKASFTKVYITSNVHWEDWYSGLFERTPMLKEALKRRIKSITHMQTL